VGYTSVPILVFLYRPLCSRLRPDVRDRQMSDAHNCSIPPIIGVRQSQLFLSGFRQNLKKLATVGGGESRAAALTGDVYL